MIHQLSATDGPFAETKEMSLAWLGARRHRLRAYPRSCAACGMLLAAAGSVLFQGDHLVHARCWRADPAPLLDPVGPALVRFEA
jgi:hypothetical protein